MLPLSENIDNLRKLSNKTISQLADDASISAAALGKFFSGKTDIGASKLVKVLDSLEINIPGEVTQKLREKTGLTDSDSQRGEDDLLLLFTHLDGIDKKIVLNTLVKALSKSKSKALQDAIKRVKARVSKL